MARYVLHTSVTGRSAASSGIIRDLRQFELGKNRILSGQANGYLIIDKKEFVQLYFQVPPPGRLQMISQRRNTFLRIFVKKSSSVSDFIAGLSHIFNLLFFIFHFQFSILQKSL